MFAAVAGTVLLASGGAWLRAADPAPDDSTVFHVDVNMVVVTFTVTDGHGQYISGVKPQELQIFEDGIPQRISSFAEGRGPLRRDPGDLHPAPEIASSVFVLFDTSNGMYGTFAYAEDAISSFIRGLPASQSVALYSFSRNLTRDVPLTQDRGKLIRGLRNTVAGDDTALFNALLLTVRDAAKVTGRRVVVVFSNGPDNASILSPADVQRVAEEEGIPIYVISTEARNPLCKAVFERISTQTGGQAYFADTWQKQAAAFRAIEEDLAHSYTLAYYPQPNPNTGFRKIDIRFRSENGKNYVLRARPGYQPHRTEIPRGTKVTRNLPAELPPAAN